MRKFLIKTFALLISAGGLFTWFRADASVLAGAAALGLDDSSGWLAAQSQDPKPFNLIESTGAGYARVALPFDEVSAAPGIFTWSYQGKGGTKDFAQLFAKLEKRGIRPVVVLSGGPVYGNHLYPQQPVFRDELLEYWAGYLRAAVQEFGDTVDTWQVGDVVNDPSNWGKVVFPAAEAPIAIPDPALYAEMLKIAYSVIKSSQSTDTVLLGGLALGTDCAFSPIAYLEALNENDAWYAFDALSLELPVLNGLPESVGVETCGSTPVQSSGKPLADAVRAVADYANEKGGKLVWVHNLAFTKDFLSAQSAQRGTLFEAAESDYLARATAILLAEGGANKVFWRYVPQNTKPGPIALQSFANLNRALGGSHKNEGVILSDGSAQVMRFRGSGKISALIWRSEGGDEFSPAVVPGFENFNPYAWSADAESLKQRDGIELAVDAGGNVALMVSERPVIVSGTPDDLKQSLTLFLSDSAAQASQGLKGKIASWAQAQKAKAAEKVGAWVEEQQQSLMETLKASFNQWLRKSLGLAKM